MVPVDRMRRTSDRSAAIVASRSRRYSSAGVCESLDPSRSHRASGRAAILGYTMPIWSALLGIVLYRENPSRRLWVGVLGAVSVVTS